MDATCQSFVDVHLETKGRTFDEIDPVLDLLPEILVRLLEEIR
jgi:hypothetical protein